MLSLSGKGGVNTGWVAVEGEKAVLPRCRVRANPVESIQPVVGAARSTDLARPVPTVPDKTGFFALSGLAPGAYDLEADCPPNLKGKLERVPVQAGAESRIPRAILVQPPRSLVLRLEPPVDPTGSPWEVPVTAFQSDLAALAFSENERPLSLQAGSYRIQGLEPGSYLLAVRDARGAAYLEEELLFNLRIR